MNFLRITAITFLLTFSISILGKAQPVKQQGNGHDPCDETPKPPQCQDHNPVPIEGEGILIIVGFLLAGVYYMKKVHVINIEKTID